MRVLFIGEDLATSKGGIVTVMRQLLEDQELNKEIKYKTIFTTGDNYSAFRKVTSWTKAYLLFIFYLPFYRIIHIHHAANLNFWLTTVFVHLARLFRRKIILHNHGADFRQFYERMPSPLQKYLRYTFSVVSRNLVLSKSWLSWYKSIAPGARWQLLPNAIEIPSSVTYKSFRNGEARIVYLARLEERKGLFDLIDILPDLFSVCPNCKLFVAGQGDKEMIQRLINMKNVERNVELLGYINAEQRDRLLRSCHIFLLPSYDEGLPMALLEAMSYALVPIATPVGGIPDVVVNHQNGILIQPGDKDALLGSILVLLKQNGMVTNMSKNAYKTIVEDCNWNANRQHILNLYRSLNN